MILIVLMAAAGLAGCVGDEDEETTDSGSTMDASDGGYTYASNVDNHRSLMKDLCDIKTAASAFDFATAKDIYQNGKNAEKSDGSYRTLAGFASAEGKAHGYDDYYGQAGSIDAHITAALDGTGDFAGTSDTVRYQGVAKLTANMGMIAYTIHELNTAVAKADDGNVDDDTGAPHNWDEGWAFFHGPDEDLSCAPANTFKKRSTDFGTETNGVSNTLNAVETAMVDGLAALQAQDQAGYTAATNTVVKNVIITYTQATMKYTYKMDDADNGPKYQAEGYAFWKVIEAYVADYTDACYNNKTHTMSYIGAGQATDCDGFQYYENYTMPDGSTFTGCYNMDTHVMANMATGPTGAEMDETNCNEGFGAMSSTGQPMYYDNYGANEINEIVDLQDPSKLGTSYDIAPHMQMVLAHYGITADELGTYA